MSNLFAEATLGRAAFELMSSSSPARYERKAREWSAKSRLTDEFGMGTVDEAYLVAEAEQLWTSILGSTDRDTAEVELALALPVLAQVASAGANEVLLKVALADGHNVAWLAGLARSLYRRRGTNTQHADSETNRPRTKVANRAARNRSVGRRALLNIRATADASTHRLAS